MYWEIGRLILEEEQHGEKRANYGKSVLKTLGQTLSIEFGAGFDERNLNNMRAFYHAFPIWNAVRTELSWTHYRILCRIEQSKLRDQYKTEAISGNWNTRTLQRNIDSQYLGRMLQTGSDGNADQTVGHFVKDPYIYSNFWEYPPQKNFPKLRLNQP
jgi:hypothetical protein